jgi:hypothetical protein
MPEDGDDSDERDDERFVLPTVLTCLTCTPKCVTDVLHRAN